MSGADGGAVLDLASNLHPHGPHPAVVEAARGAALDRYPEPGAATLRAEVARAIGVSREQVLITAGATEAIHLAPRAVLGPGDACTVFAPAFGEYERAAIAGGFRVERHEALPPGFAPPGDPPRALLTIIANPSSPAGVYLDEAAIRRVLRVARGVLLLDAVYEPFVEGAWDANKLVRDGLPVLAVHSFTKLHAIPGPRVGYVAGPAPLIGRLEALQPAWSVSAPALAAARAALPLDAERRAAAGEVAAVREAMRGFLAARGVEVSPARANFVLARTGDGRAMREAMLRRGIEVRDCASFGLAEWVRIAVPPSSALPRLVDGLAAALDELA